jgi:hypothetical protein
VSDGDLSAGASNPLRTLARSGLASGPSTLPLPQSPACPLPDVELAELTGHSGARRAPRAQARSPEQLLTWAHRNDVMLRLIEPSKPNQNPYVESFNSRTGRSNSHQIQNLSVAAATPGTQAAYCTRMAIRCINEPT